MKHLTTPDGTSPGGFAFGAMQFGGKADAAQSQAMYDACRAAGITHFDTAWIYTGGAQGRLREENRYARRYKHDWMYNVARELTDLAGRNGTDATTLAVAWVAAHSTGVIPIISRRTAQQLRPSLAAMTYEMPDDLYNWIRALSPTPPLATDRSEEQK